MLSVTDGVVRRRGRDVVSGVSLSVSTGVTVLLGPNGAGKTTLVNALMGLLPLASGRVTYAGERVATAEEWRSARARVGWLPQGFGYPRGIRVDQFVGYAAWLKGVSRARLQARVEEALGMVGLAEFARRRMRQLSGGELQRVGLAAALVAGPSTLLLDEPTAGLDPVQRQRFHEIITRIARSNEGVGVLLSTHLFEDAAAVADRIVVLRSGQRVFSTDKHELARDGEAVTVENVRAAVMPYVEDA